MMSKDSDTMTEAPAVDDTPEQPAPPKRERTSALFWNVYRNVPPPSTDK